MTLQFLVPEIIQHRRIKYVHTVLRCLGVSAGKIEKFALIWRAFHSVGVLYSYMYWVTGYRQINTMQEHFK